MLRISSFLLSFPSKVEKYLKNNHSILHSRFKNSGIELSLYIWGGRTVNRVIRFIIFDLMFSNTLKRTAQGQGDRGRATGDRENN